jgi:uncharacterized LabA/DUF88 family protein
MVNNITSKFLLPLLGKYSSYFILREEFVGAFIGDEKRPEKDGELLLVYKYPMTIEWAEFESKLKELPNYTGDYDYNDERYVVYTFSLDDYEEDFEKIMTGSYSQVSPETKLKISKFWHSNPSGKLIKKAVNVDDTLLLIWDSWKKTPEKYCEEGELWYRPRIKEEIFDINNYN